MTVDAIALDVPLSPAPEAPPPARDPADALAKLGATLVESGAIDQRTLDRARRVADETGGRLDQVLTQLGLVSERGLAEALARLIGAPLVGGRGLSRRAAVSRSAEGQISAPGARAADRRDRGLHDPRDGRSARRLYPQRGRGGARPAGRWSPSPCRSSSRPPSTGSMPNRARRRRHGAARRGGARCRAGRRGCRAAQGSGERGAGDPAGQSADRAGGRDPCLGRPHRAVSGPAAGALPLRRGAARDRAAAGAAAGRRHLAHQDHGAARHRRAPAAAGRPHQADGARPRDRFPGVDDPLAARREGRAARARPHRRRVRLREARLAGGYPRRGSNARSNCRTAWCW